MDTLRNKFLTGLFLLTCSLSKAQTVSQLIAINSVGTESDLRSAHDGSDNLFVGGTRVIQNVQNQDGPGNLFVRKYDSQGNLQWTIGSNYTATQNTVQLTDIDTDLNGNLYVTGTYNTTFLTIGDVTYTDAGNMDSGHNVFFAKINSQGTVQWITGFRENLYPENICTSNTVTVTSDQHVVFTGAYFKDIVIGLDTLSGVPSASSGGQAPRFFITKYRSDGTPLWAKSWKNLTDSDLWTAGYIAQVAAGKSNDLYMTVSSETGIVTPTDTIGQDASVSVIKLDEEANVLAESPIYSPYADLTGLTTDVCGNVIVAGSFLDSVTTGSLTAVHSSVPEDRDMYLIRYDENLQPLWINRFGSSGGDNTGNVASNDRNAIFFTYEYWGTVDTPEPHTPSPSGFLDLAIVKVDSNGIFQWWQHSVGTGHAQRGELIVSSSNMITCLGRYMGTEQYGSNTITSTNGNTADVFVVQLTDTLMGTTPSECATLSVTENEPVDLQFMVYPNPADDYLFVQLSSEVNQPVTAYIRSLTGQLVFSGIITDRLYIPGLAEGMYLLEIPSLSGHSVLFMKH